MPKRQASQVTGPLATSVLKTASLDCLFVCAETVTYLLGFEFSIAWPGRNLSKEREVAGPHQVLVGSSARVLGTIAVSTLPMLLLTHDRGWTCTCRGAHALLKLICVGPQSTGQATRLDCFFCQFHCAICLIEHQTAGPHPENLGRRRVLKRNEHQIRRPM